MKILKQLALLFAICILGEAVGRILPFMIPASILGMAALFLMLLTGILKKESIHDVSSFLLENMSFLFIPAGVSVLKYFDRIQAVWIQLLVIIIITTILTFAATAGAVTLAIRIRDRRRKQHE